MVGPATPLRRANQAKHSKPTLNACEMVSVETGQGIAVALDVSRQLEGNYAFLQVGSLLPLHLKFDREWGAAPL